MAYVVLYNKSDITAFFTLCIAAREMTRGRFLDVLRKDRPYRK